MLLGLGVLACKNRLELCCIPISRVLPQEYISLSLTGRPRQQWNQKTLEAFSPPAPKGSSIGSLWPTQPGETSRRDRISHPPNDTKMWYTNHVLRWFKMHPWFLASILNLTSYKPRYPKNVQEMWPTLSCQTEYPFPSRVPSTPKTELNPASNTGEATVAECGLSFGFFTDFGQLLLCLEIDVAWLSA